MTGVPVSRVVNAAAETSVAVGLLFLQETTSIAVVYVVYSADDAGGSAVADALGYGCIAVCMVRVQRFTATAGAFRRSESAMFGLRVTSFLIAANVTSVTGAAPSAVIPVVRSVAESPLVTVSPSSTSSHHSNASVLTIVLAALVPAAVVLLGAAAFAVWRGRARIRKTRATRRLQLEETMATRVKLQRQQEQQQQQQQVGW
jgi:hypothetical protein